MAMSVISAVSPLLMGLMNPTWPYWYMAFWAMLLLPFANDGMSSLLSTFSHNSQITLSPSTEESVVGSSADACFSVLFIVAAVVITNSFSDSKQALAGSVLNTVAQFGSAVGLAIMAVISSTVTDGSNDADKNSPAALLEGYRATFWACLGSAVLYCAIGAVGLRAIGKVGLKEE